MRCQKLYTNGGLEITPTHMRLFPELVVDEILELRSKLSAASRSTLYWMGSASWVAAGVFAQAVTDAVYASKDRYILQQIEQARERLWRHCRWCDVSRIDCSLDGTLLGGRAEMTKVEKDVELFHFIVPPWSEYLWLRTEAKLLMVRVDSIEAYELIER